MNRVDEIKYPGIISSPTIEGTITFSQSEVLDLSQILIMEVNFLYV